MDTTNLPTPAPSVGDSGPLRDSVANSGDNPVKCVHCEEPLSRHIALPSWGDVVLWPLYICRGQFEDLDQFEGE